MTVLEQLEQLVDELNDWSRRPPSHGVASCSSCGCLIVAGVEFCTACASASAAAATLDPATDERGT